MTDTHSPGFAVLPSAAKAEAGRLPQLAVLGAIGVQPDALDTTSDKAGGFLRRELNSSSTLQPKRAGVSSSIVTGGGQDIASLSRKRRDLALANVRQGHTPALPSPRAMPGARLKLLAKTPPLALGASSPLAPTAAGALTALSNISTPAPFERVSPACSPSTSEHESHADVELRRLREQIQMKDRQLLLCQAELQKRNEEFEGCVANLNVAQAELALCQERLRTITLPVVLVREDAQAELALCKLEKEHPSLEDLEDTAGETNLVQNEQLAKDWQKEWQQLQQENERSLDEHHLDQQCAPVLDQRKRHAGQNDRRARLVSSPHMSLNEPHLDQQSAQVLDQQKQHAGQDDERARLVSSSHVSLNEHHSDWQSAQVMHQRKTHAEQDDKRARLVSSPHMSLNEPHLDQQSTQVLDQQKTHAGQDDTGTRLVSSPHMSLNEPHSDLRSPQLLGQRKTHAEQDDKRARLVSSPHMSLNEPHLDQQSTQILDQRKTQAGQHEIRARLVSSPDTGGTLEAEVPDGFGIASETLGTQAHLEAQLETLSADRDKHKQANDETTKQLQVANEEIRLMKVVQKQSKEELQYYSKVLEELKREHAEDLTKLRDELALEQKRSKDDMECWKAHLKREQVNDPVVSTALRKWDKEVQAMLRFQAFKEWHRRCKWNRSVGHWSNQLFDVYSFHESFATWKDFVVKQKADRMKSLIVHRRMTVGNVVTSWSQSSDRVLLGSIFAEWQWQTKLVIFDRRAGDNVKANLQRWMNTSFQALRISVVQCWHSLVIEQKHHAFNRRRANRTETLHKTVLNWAPSQMMLDSRIYFSSWKQYVARRQVELLTQRNKKAEHLLDRSVLALVSESELVSRHAAFRAWAECRQQRKIDELTAKLNTSVDKGSIYSAMAAWGNELDIFLLQSVIRGWVAKCRRALDIQDGHAKATFSIVRAEFAWDLLKVQIMFHALRKLAKRTHILKGLQKVFKPADDSEHAHVVFAVWAKRVQRVQYWMNRSARIVNAGYRQRMKAIGAWYFQEWRMQWVGGARLVRTHKAAMYRWHVEQILALLHAVIHAWALEVRLQELTKGKLRETEALTRELEKGKLRETEALTRQKLIIPTVHAEVQTSGMSYDHTGIQTELLRKSSAVQVDVEQGGVQTDVQTNVQTEVQTEIQPKGQSHTQTESTKADNSAKQENLEKHLESQKLLETEHLKLKDEVQRLQLEVAKGPKEVIKEVEVVKTTCCILQ
eukprot:TRINITY_DN262_c0_g1_i4.p1 TRINITY_DN262_c0_g1~~TRINITY_DN262_c0_g1_i4.p1  ORF type:complete len:1230 (+),score=219.34 TRINITY_DN262_c0_g1_i4:224-3913(+)